MPQESFRTRVRMGCLAVCISVLCGCDTGQITGPTGHPTGQEWVPAATTLEWIGGYDNSDFEHHEIVGYHVTLTHQETEVTVDPSPCQPEAVILTILPTSHDPTTLSISGEYSPVEDSVRADLGGIHRTIETAVYVEANHRLVLRRIQRTYTGTVLVQRWRFEGSPGDFVLKDQSTYPIQYKSRVYDYWIEPCHTQGGGG